MKRFGLLVMVGFLALSTLSCLATVHQKVNAYADIAEAGYKAAKADYHRFEGMYRSIRDDAAANCRSGTFPAGVCKDFQKADDWFIELDRVAGLADATIQDIGKAKDAALSALLAASEVGVEPTVGNFPLSDD